MILRIIKPILLMTFWSASSVVAHEFWIEPISFQIPTGDPIVAQLMNGQHFAGSAQIYAPPRFSRFDLVQGDKVNAVPGRLGDRPALTVSSPNDGLLIVVHETTPASLTYAKWEKFAAFAQHKDFPDIRAQHQARNLPETGFKESYTRHVKSLISVGAGAGQDRAVGLATEFVALANPYTDDLAGRFPVQLLYGGAPRADAQVEIFDRDAEGAVTITLARTDGDGVAQIPVHPGHIYMLDAVVLRDAPAGSGAVWETLWAGLTFQLP